MKIRSALTAVFLLLFAVSAHAALQITDNNREDSYGANHGAHVDGRILWVADDEDVMFYDGTQESLVQAFDPGDPALDLVAKFSFGLGSGAGPGEVIGAWRRGADHAWVWTPGQSPVPVDTVAANQFDDEQNPVAANPEGVAIADGCLFMPMQAVDNGLVIIHVFQVDPATGAPTSVSGNGRAEGALAVRTSNCQAVWLWNPSDDVFTQRLPELHYFDGVTTTVLDAGPLSTSDLFFEDGRILYVKEVLGTPQVFLIDLNQPSVEIVQLSFGEHRRKVSPVTDGQHVAWGELNAEGAVEIALLGEMPLVRHRDDRAVRAGRFGIWLEHGQVTWVTPDGRLLRYADGRRELVDTSAASSVINPQVSRGKIAWYGEPAIVKDHEIFLHDAPAPAAPTGTAPPIWIQADLGPDRVALRWSRVLGATHYNVYLAEEPGVTPHNVNSLTGGRRYLGVQSPFAATGLPPDRTYYAVVTSSEGSSEGAASHEVQTRGFLVDTTEDRNDASIGDGICTTNQGTCSLRAAVQEAGALGGEMSVAVPAGTYVLFREFDGGGPLPIEQTRVLGAGRDLTIVDAGGSQFVADLDPGEEGGRVFVSDLTFQGGVSQGVINRGVAVLERVRMAGNGSVSSTGTGAGFYSTGQYSELNDCLIEDNTTTSHGGGLRFWNQGGALNVVRRSRIRNNTAGIGGGGIYMRGDAVIIDSEVDGNTSAFQQNWPGGGIYQESNGWLKVVGSSFHHNTSGDGGGGLYIGPGEAHLINTTVSHNHADDEGGGLYANAFSANGHIVWIWNSTFFDNTSGTGDDTLYVDDDVTLLLANTALRTTGQRNCSASGTILTFGYNVENRDTCRLDVDDQVSTDPQLGPLTDHGGPTPTHAPQPGSPLIDGGTPSGCLAASDTLLRQDQRGASRGGVAGRCDVGAFEELGPCVDQDADGFADLANPSCPGGFEVDCDDSDPTIHPGAAQVCDGLNNDCGHYAWPALYGTNESDGDGDGISSCAGDCHDADSTIWGTPGETGGMVWLDPVSMAWDPPADLGGFSSSLRYDVTRSDSPADPGATGTCLASEQAGRDIADPSLPAAGDLFIYLSRARNGCPAGVGSWGQDSTGAERNIEVCP
ncbi:hypothetical protein ABI59_06850 [Acidobacteria bacterium Mor1]|nr:hypothetical protein ABI59_06850 [Acidobacteria bacterium Mor1]